MPKLDWIGKKAVVNHYREVPFHLLKNNDELSVGDPGSGNLTLAGLSKQGELSDDVLDHDACGALLQDSAERSGLREQSSVKVIKRRLRT